MLVGSVLGLALAQQGATPTPGTPAPGQTAPGRPGHQAFIDALARQLGITSERLQQAMTAARNEVGLTGGSFGGRHGPGRGGMDLTAAAQAIGISADQLRQELPGKSLAQVAQAHGRNPADVATALKNAANQRIDQAVANGRLNATQATDMKQRAAQRIDQLMNEVKTQFGPGGPGRGNGVPGPGPSSAPSSPTPRS